MDCLSKLAQFLVHFDFRLTDGFLRAVDCVREQRARVIDAVNIDTILEFDAFGCQKTAEVSEEFAFLDRFHITMA